MNTRNAPTYEFADSSPVRSGRMHRRGMGNATNSRKISATSQSSSLSAGAQSQTTTHQQQAQSQSSYYTTDAWDNAEGHHRKDDDACAGSLTYSACSSEDNAGADNKTSFAEIIKIIESEVQGEGVAELKASISNKKLATSGMGGGDNSSGGGNRGSCGRFDNETAVAGRMQRADNSGIQQHKEQQTTVKKQSSAAAMVKRVPTVDDRDEDCVFGVGFDENVLETIAG
jgi:hypothetical protein